MCNHSRRVERVIEGLSSSHGALYRKGTEVFSKADIDMPDQDLFFDSEHEIIQRIQTLQNQGIHTDLDVLRMFIEKKELCCSIFKYIFGMPVGVIQKRSVSSEYAPYLDRIRMQMGLEPYFFMAVSIGSIRKLAVLFLSSDPDQRKAEHEALDKQHRQAVVVDLNTNQMNISPIRYEFLSGGPVFLV